jgi:hypothetical protein
VINSSADGLVEHDMHIGQFLEAFEEYPPRQKAALRQSKRGPFLVS